MSSVKELVKKTAPFVYDIHKKRIEKKENEEREKWNKLYDEAIAELLNLDVLNEKINDLKVKILSNEEVTYYIVATENSKLGIYGYINCFLPHIAYAVYKGWIPVIDMKNYSSIYQKGGNNAWELFYRQPFNVSFDDLESNKNVIVCPTRFWYHNLPNSFPMMDDKYIDMWSTIYRELICYNQDADKYINEELKDILKHPEKTIGLIYRGTTYTKGQAKGHPIQPTMSMLKKDVEKLFLNGYEYIYVASDEKSIVDYLNEYFPGKVLINKRVFYDENDIDYSRYNLDGTDITADSFERENNHYLIGIEYISSINIIAKCECLLAGACGGTTAALYLNGLKYRGKQVYNLGRYGIDKVPEEYEE